MAERLSGKQRIELRNLAEDEIKRYANDHARWHKHIHNVELDAMQVLKCNAMDQHPNSLDYSCRRTGKTAVKELYHLKYLACNPDQELGIVAPREAQSITALDYQLEAIRRSPILDAFVDYKAGRRRISDTSYQFANRSKAAAYGIMANVDGGDLTIASLEEVDDMPHDRLFSRFLLMLGSTRRLGASKHSKNDPQIRITGVFKGADTLQELVDDGSYRVLPLVDAYLGIEMGILNEAFILQMQRQLSPDEYIRQLLCKNIAARNLIWEKWIRHAIHLGIKARIEPTCPLPGLQYKKRGLISFGYDHSGHGEDPSASRSALIVWEQLGSFLTPIYARTWPPGTDDRIVKEDLLSYWRYYRPDCAMGDAFGVGMLSQLNDDLHLQGLTDIDRRTIGDGQSTASTWGDWAFAPIRFEGMLKHQMASALRSLFSNQRAVLPYVDDIERDDPERGDQRWFQQQLSNIKALATSKSYSSYQMVKKSLGDDLFDAAMAGLWAIINRGGIHLESIITSRTISRQQHLGHVPTRLPSDPVK